MKYFIKNHQEQILLISSFLFLLIIAAYFLMGIQALSNSAKEATTIDTSRFQPSGFNIEQAEHLDYHGLDKP